MASRNNRKRVRSKLEVLKFYLPKSKRSKFVEGDMLIEIFKRCSVKTLGILRCVCKSWNSLISSPWFITLHYNSTTSNSFLVFNSEFYVFCSPDDQEGIPTLETFLHFPALPTKLHVLNEIVGIVHGIVCLTFTFPTSKKLGNPNIKIVWNPTMPIQILWNPTIKKYIEIPRSSTFDDLIQYRHCLGFGFCGLKQDFRLIRLSMTFFEKGDMKPMSPAYYEVFSVKEGVWREKKELDSNIGQGVVVSTSGFFMNGCVHWIVSPYFYDVQEQTYGDYYMLIYDCDREEFKTLELPREWKVLKELKHRFFIFQGELSVWRLDDEEYWSMEEYGVPSTWKCHALDPYMIELYTTISKESMFLMNDPKVNSVS